MHSSTKGVAMSKVVEVPNRWRVPFGRYGGGHWEGPLFATWEAHLDPISDGYRFSEVSADALLQIWARKVSEEHPDGLIPIHWFVESEEAAKFNILPFAYDHFHGESRITQEDFLWHYGWPTHAVTQEPLNWCELPVVDKLWNENRADKGGFIQQATGWKPSIYQPFVYLPSLLRAGQV